MATFIVSGGDDGGVIDPALDLARYIYAVKGSDPPPPDFQIKDSQALDLALENLDKILTPLGEKEKDRDAVEGVINVVCSVFQRVLVHDTAPADAATLVNKFISKLTSNTTLQPALRLKTLSTVYNILGGNGTARYNTFLAMITYAAASGKEHLAIVTPHCAHLDSMFTEWGTDLDKRRALYTAIFDGMIKHDNSDGAHEYRLKFLASFQGQKDQSAALKQAIVAVEEAIANPKIYLFDSYLDLNAVQALKTDGANSKVFDLLQIFASDDLDTFNKFYGQNSAFVDGLGVKKEECVRKIRLLSLCTLASSKQEMKYSEIASCMQIGEAEVESWVIKAITAKLLDAKMDQLTKTATVNHCAERVFSKKQWGALRDKIGAWRDNMKGLLHMIESARQSQLQHAQEMQGSG